MEKNDNNEISVDGQIIGQIDGFIFQKKEDASDEAVTEDVNTFITQTLESQIDQLINEGDAALRIENDFTIRRKGAIIAKLKKTDEILAPDFDIHVDARIEGLPLARLALHIQSRIKRQINLALDPLEVVRKTEELSEDGKIFVDKLVQGMGYLVRSDVDDIVRKIGTEERTKLRKSGVRFAQYGVFVRDILKPMAQEIKLILWALYNDLEAVPESPPAGVVTIAYNPDLPEGYYAIVGYKVCGQYAVRADMIEKLADAVRSLAMKSETNPNGEFEITAQHMSFVGKSGDAFDAILKSLGYSYRSEVVKVLTVKPTVESDKKDDADEELSKDIVAEATEEDIKTEIEESTTSIEPSQEADVTEALQNTNDEAKSDNESDKASSTEMIETEVEKKIWFWANHCAKKKTHHKKASHKTGDKHKKGDSKTDKAKKKNKSHASNKKSHQSNDNKKSSKPVNSPYVNMPGTHKVKDENNPFAALSALKK
ncbi:MAG: hypothetical protein AAF621_02690 [Pseudomonadota bacterium]